jgi:hypothetical protein
MADPFVRITKQLLDIVRMRIVLRYGNCPEFDLGSQYLANIGRF